MIWNKVGVYYLGQEEPLELNQVAIVFCCSEISIFDITLPLVDRELSLLKVCFAPDGWFAIVRYIVLAFSIIVDCEYTLLKGCFAPDGWFVIVRKIVLALSI